MVEAVTLTIIRRPYVFALLALFLVSSIRARGITKTAAFLGWGYLVAWASEALSIRTGIPYGLYHYNPAAFAGELQLAGVPVFDSISYSFMAYAAAMVSLKFARARWWSYPLMTAALTTLLDVIVDPLAIHGDEWFLGPIFQYATPGIYFGVPFSNFAGWFWVALVIAAGYYAIDRHIKTPTEITPQPIREGTALYFVIGLFNIGISMCIGRWSLAAAGCGWLAGLGLLMKFVSPPPRLLPRK